MLPRVAIIGGGISGLGAAWSLKMKENFRSEITVFQDGPVGGNCVTGTFPIGDLFRWCDLGVNDFNTNNYREVVEVMDLLGVEYKLLEDTACFFKGDNSVVYTIGGPRDVAISGKLAAEYLHFKKYAAGDLDKHPEMRTWTITEYLQRAGYSESFAKLCILPRVNAMYFCSDDGAANMPFAAIMHYYVLQEGFGKDVTPQRMYFVNGSQRWMDALQYNLRKDFVVRFVQDQGRVKVVPVSGAPLGVQTSKGTEPFDIVIMAIHADDALAAIAPQMVRPELASALKTVKYTSSEAVAHTDTRLLPANRNAWRTYNVRIRDDAEPQKPYQMTYVENRHQNDRAGIFDHYGLSEFFVSLNPYIQPRPELVLKDVNGNDLRATFRHNVVDVPTMQMQENLKQMQGMNNIFFTGGWTNGAGLHIECWLQSADIANRIAPGVGAPAPELVGAGAPARMPHYFSRAIDTYDEHPPVPKM